MTQILLHPSLAGRSIRLGLSMTLTVALGGALALAAEEPSAPKVGQKAKDFTLESLGGGTATLGELKEQGPVVLVVLRGYPGYQCPICSRQVVDLVAHASDFEKAGSQVVLVYPGPPEKLKARAEEFVGGTVLPENFTMVLDPDYDFTNTYGLRWDAPRETAYPSAFVIDRDGTIQFAKISKSHGGRAGAEEILKALEGLETH